jgi:membrane protease YdiL (CAAX protease family)
MTGGATAARRSGMKDMVMTNARPGDNAASPEGFVRSLRGGMIVIVSAAGAVAAATAIEAALGSGAGIGAGLAAGLLATGSLVTPIAMHMVFNVGNVLLVLAGT